MPIKPWRATCIQMPSRVARTAADRGEAWAIITGNIERGLMLIDRSMAAEPPPRLVLLPEFAFQGPPRGADWAAEIDAVISTRVGTGPQVPA